MKNITLLITTIFSLFFAIATSAQTATVRPSAPALETAEQVLNQIQKDIFFFDPESKIVFIDFAGAKETIAKVEVLKDQESLYFDDVQDMSKNTIYEIPMRNYNGQFYTIVLTTNTNKIFRQSVWLQANQLIWN